MRCASAAARKISLRSERSVSSHDAMYAAPLVNSHSPIPSSAKPSPGRFPRGVPHGHNRVSRGYCADRD